MGEDKRLNEKQTTGLHDFFLYFAAQAAKYENTHQKMKM